MPFGGGAGGGRAASVTTGAGGGEVTGSTHPGAAPAWTAAEAAAVAAVEPAQTAVCDATLAKALRETSGSTIGAAEGVAA